MLSNRLAAILGVALFLVLIVGWTFWPREKPVVGVSVPLPPAKEVKSVEKIVYQPKYIYVYPDKSKTRLNLPKSLSEDPSKKLVATGKLEAEEREYSLSAVLDTDTGDSKIYANPQPIPLIGPGRHGGIGLGYGLKNDGPSVMIYGYQELLRIKRINAGVRAELDQRGDYWAGLTLEYKW